MTFSVSFLQSMFTAKNQKAALWHFWRGANGSMYTNVNLIKYIIEYIKVK